MTLDEFEHKLNAVCSAYEAECIAAGKKFAAALDPLMETASDHLTGETLAALVTVRMRRMEQTIKASGEPK